MKTMQFTAEETTSAVSVAAAVLNLGNVDFLSEDQAGARLPVGEGKSALRADAKPWAEAAARLLSVDVVRLHAACLMGGDC
jgi:hypothetical protein